MSDDRDRDALAAEYVLGSLDGEAAREAAHLLASDAAFARSVRDWEQRLAPLAAVVEAVAPPAALWDRIAVSTAPPAEIIPFRRRVRFWQGTTAASLAIAASLAAFVVLRPAAPIRVAVLAPLAGGAPVLVATAGGGNALVIRPNGSIAVPDGRDLELWALADGDTRPRSLGVLPAAGRQLVASLAPNTQLLVSLEPRGGSPTGVPTGPVLYGGRLTVVN